MIEISYRRIQKTEVLEADGNFYNYFICIDSYEAIIGAYHKSDLVGVIKIDNKGDNNYEINYLFVLPIFRKLGIGSKLLFNTEKYCESIKAHHIKFITNTSDHIFTKVNSFLIKNNWTPLVYHDTKYRIKSSDFETHFVKKMFKYNLILQVGDSKICCLNELSLIDKQKINSKSLVKEGLKLFTKSRLKYIVPELSIFIKDGDDFIAWCVVEQKRNNELSVAFIYVDEEYRNSGIGIKLLHLAFRKYIEIPDNHCCFFSFLFDKENIMLLKLHTILFEHYIHSSTDYFSTIKQIS